MFKIFKLFELKVKLNSTEFHFTLHSVDKCDDSKKRKKIKEKMN